MVGPVSIRQLKKEGPFFSSAPGTDGVWSARLRGQSPCAVPEGHRTHQPPRATTPSQPAPAFKCGCCFLIVASIH
jgi:hypothetical protein